MITLHDETKNLQTKRIPSLTKPPPQHTTNTKGTKLPDGHKITTQVDTFLSLHQRVMISAHDTFPTELKGNLQRAMELFYDRLVLVSQMRLIAIQNDSDSLRALDKSCVQILIFFKNVLSQSSRDSSGASQAIVDLFFSPDRISSLLHLIIERFFRLNSHDLDLWESDPESFVSEDDFNDISSNPRVCCLFLFLFYLVWCLVFLSFLCVFWDRRIAIFGGPLHDSSQSFSLFHLSHRY